MNDPVQYPPFHERLRVYLVLCKDNLRRHWWHMLVPIAIIFLAQFWIRLDVNYTDSLHHRLYLTLKGNKTLKRDNYVAFLYRHNKPGILLKDGDHAMKRICGIEGDIVEIDDKRYVWIINVGVPAGIEDEIAKISGEFPRDSADTPWKRRFVGIAKSHSKGGVPVNPIAGGVIPPGKFFACAPHPDSLDSRYDFVGLVDIENDVMGRSIPLF
jgi:hypothetical protein